MKSNKTANYVGTPFHLFDNIFYFPGEHRIPGPRISGHGRRQLEGGEVMKPTQSAQPYIFIYNYSNPSFAGPSSTRPIYPGNEPTNDTIEGFYDDLEVLEERFYWWWHEAQHDIDAIDELIGLAESLLERSAKSRHLSIRDKRWICRAAFMIHEMCICFDGSGSREKLPY